jgi:hypothetical protein
MRPLLYFSCGLIIAIQSPYASAQSPQIAISGWIAPMREMIGKPMLDQVIDFNNKSSFILEALTPDGARFFIGGSSKTAGATADNLRQEKIFSILITPCPGAHDLGAKIASIAMWQTIVDESAKVDESSKIGLGMEQLLAMMNTPPGVVTPSTLRVPRTKDLRGPVFEYVRGDTTEALGLVNEGAALRINWSTTNMAVCPR